MGRSLHEMTNEELWQLFPIILKPHDPAWCQQYKKEEERLLANLNEFKIIRISHIGSTVVPDIYAKPTVDILMEVAKMNSTKRKALIASLTQMGYLYSYQKHQAQPRMMFMKGYTPSGFAPEVFHLHVRYHKDWDELYFCQYLITHPDVAKEYEELKLSLKESFKHDRDGYTYAKTAFIKKWTKIARLEANESL